MGFNPRKGAGASMRSGSSSNVRQRRRSIKSTTANLKVYPGNFTLDIIAVNFTTITGAFYDSEMTLWAKE